MSRFSKPALIFLACLFAPPAVRAGLYITTETDPYPLPTAFEDMKKLLPKRMVSDPALKTPERAEAQKKVSELEKKVRGEGAAITDWIDLSGYYIRLGFHEKAIPVLQQGLRQAKEDAPERFLLLANMASAYQNSPELLARAVAYQKDALAAAPAKPPLAAWSQDQWDQMRIAEKYQLSLLEERQREAGFGRGTPWKTVYAIFPRVRFLGPSGSYEAGKLAAASRHELPSDALPIVVQLYLWQPTDLRLRWLYGEVLNATGNVQQAYPVLDDLITNRNLGGVRELVEHRRTLRAAYVPPKEVEDAPAPPDTPPPPAKAGVDWRAIATGFGAGLLVALFGGMQLYIWAKRRSRAASMAAMADQVREPVARPAPSEHVAAPVHEIRRAP